MEADLRPLRVLIVDDQAEFLHLVSEVIGISPRFTVIGEASDGPQAIRMTAEREPDVVLMDIQMSGMSGLEAAGTIVARFPTVRVVLMSAYEEEEYGRLAIESGAAGFIPKMRLSARALSEILGRPTSDPDRQ